jgi:periplasmic copper chaperone A
MKVSRTKGIGDRRASLAVAAVATGTVVGLAGPAFAHVTVDPGEVTQGETEKLTFRVPTESDTAGTVKLRVSFPTDTPVASVRVKAHPGWTANVVTTKLSKPVNVGDLSIDKPIRSITWTADEGVRIGPGEFDEFEVLVGPFPNVDGLRLPAVQTHDDGEVVRWDQPVHEGEPEPEHPAPTLTLQPRAMSASEEVGDQSDSRPNDDAAATRNASGPAVDTIAQTLSGFAVGIGILCLIGIVGLAIVVHRTRRRT